MQADCEREEGEDAELLKANAAHVDVEALVTVSSGVNLGRGVRLTSMIVLSDLPSPLATIAPPSWIKNATMSSRTKIKPNLQALTLKTEADGVKL